MKHDNNAYVCGIDFGTSNSTCSIFNGKTVEMVPLEGDRTVIPSALFFDTNGVDVLFGRDAFQAYMDGEDGRLLRGLKSILGTSLMFEKTLVGKKKRTFEDILSIFLSNIKTKADHFSGQNIKNVVMGRPVHFHDNNHDADKKSEDVLRQIAQNIGFENVSFQYEPIAAAYAHEQNIEKQTMALVVDLGGGTSDFTVMRLTPRHMKQETNSNNRQDDIFATSGIRVGGTNFDKNLSLAHFMPEFGLGGLYKSAFEKDKWFTMPSKIYHELSDWPFIPMAQTQAAILETQKIRKFAKDPDQIDRLLHIQNEHMGHALLKIVEQTKIKLSDVDHYAMSLNEVDIDRTVTVSRDDFLTSIDDLLCRIETSMLDCVSQSGYSKDDIGLIVLTGGSSELPAIQNLVHKHFPQAQLSKDDKFGSVGKGLVANNVH